MRQILLAFMVTASFVAGRSKSPQPAPAPATRDTGGDDADAAAVGDGGPAPGPHDVGARATGTNDRCGYVDELGQFVIQRRFDQAYNFAASLAAVGDHGKWGFINPRGEYAIKPAFDKAKSFREGLAAASIAGKGWGFIQTGGAWAIPPGFAEADSFSDGLAVVKDEPAAARDGSAYDYAEEPATPVDGAPGSQPNAARGGRRSGCGVQVGVWPPKGSDGSVSSPASFESARDRHARVAGRRPRRHAGRVLADLKQGRGRRIGTGG